MSSQKQLEAKMDELLVKNAPFQIPESGRKAIVDIAPVLAIIGAILSFLAAIGLWNLAHRASEITNSVNDLARAYGVDTGYNSLDYGVLFYVSFVVLAVQGLLMAIAASGLKARSKRRGWDLLLLSTLLNVVYGVLYAFTDTGSLMNLVSGLVGAVIGLYILAQIRSYYGDGSKKTAKK